MKEKTTQTKKSRKPKTIQRLIAGVLAASILVHTLEGVDVAAAGKRPTITISEEINMLVPDTPDSPEEGSENIPEEIPETVPEEIPEAVPEKEPETIPEEEPETIPEEIPESTPEEPSESMTEESQESIPEESPENSSEENQESFPEEGSENIPQKPSQDAMAYPEAIFEEIPETDLFETDENETDIEFLAAKKALAVIVSEITDHGELDYRTYMDQTVYVRLHAEKISNVEWYMPVTGSEDTGVESDALIAKEELEDVRYRFELGSAKVLEIGETEGVASVEKGCPVLVTSEDAIPLKVTGVGEVKYKVKASGSKKYSMTAASGSIRVTNSPLKDSDFYVEVSDGDGLRKYTYQEWTSYLKAHDNWVNGEVSVQLSDEGKKYFTLVKMKEEQGSYTFWAENPDRNASTAEKTNGTRSYTASMDLDAPVWGELTAESQCYEPTRTDTEQYFAEDFVLRGNVADDGSGVSRVEYTTDYKAKGQTAWVELEITDGAGTGAHEFEITLPDGCYDAIALRAYDNAGNISAVKGYVNDKGEYIRVVVDHAAPVISASASSGGQAYDGENDNWTNQDVVFDITSGRDSCPYAGVCQYEYAYVKIGDAVNQNKNMTDVSLNWTRLSLQGGAASLEVTGDKNGYYLFRAVSRSGVVTGEYVKQRILLQHRIADIKPVLVSGADDAKQKNGWYNMESGAPRIRFEYPKYDTGVTSGEYDAPVTLHYRLTMKLQDTQETPEASADGETVRTGSEKSARMGVMSSDDVTTRTNGVREFVLTEDDLGKHIIDLGHYGNAGTAQDGVYTLEYWMTDAAGNMSQKQLHTYKLDVHAPEGLTVELDGSTFPVGQESVIVYEKFYRDRISGSAGAQYGISGKGSLKIKKAKKLGEWKDMDGDSLEDAEAISILPDTRCFLYVRAEDNAGNVAEGWTQGIVVDSKAPGGENSTELIVAPQGANMHGFFNSDIEVEIRIKDAPEDDNCAALRTVLASVGHDGADTIADKELFSFTKESPTQEELVSASGFQTVQLVDAAANESNEAYIEVTAADRSGNAKTSTRLLKIDVTKPEVEIAFDNHDAVNGSFYRQGRTAAIHVRELNFDPDAVQVSVTKNGQTQDMSLSDWTGDGIDHYATVTLTGDGDYMVEAVCTDLAGNQSEMVQSEMFTIDTTAPEVTLGLFTTQEAENPDQGYFNTDVTAVITVTEHNFDAADFVIGITPEVGKGTWTHDGDVHTMHISFTEDNAYHIVCAYTDLAGNPAETAGMPEKSMTRDFIIDTALPVIRMEGLADGSANMGEIHPVITVLDPNIGESDITISVTTGLGDTVEKRLETTPVDDAGSAGWRIALTDLTDKPDNVYRLHVQARDLAGNESSLSCRFSLNRNGSVYDLTEVMKLMEKRYNTYSGLGDIRIVEMNIDTVEEFELYVSRNGALGYKAEYTREVSGSESTGYTYVYKIKNENFAREGTYRLSLYSRDRAGNEVNNAADIHGNEISFIMDNTAPRVIIDGVESGKLYDVEAQELHVSVTDNFGLSEAELILVNKAGDVLATWDYMELAGEDGTLDITIPEYGEEMSLLYRVKDAAGNEMQTFQGEQAAATDFLVTTDKLVQFINRPAQTPFGRTLIALMGCIVMLPACLLVFRKRRRRCYSSA